MGEVVKKDLCFFSRDERTHMLFRSSWHLAAHQSGIDVRVICRGFGWSNLLLSIFSFIANFRSRRLVFGTSEICLYAIFSLKKDIWIFTGLGRLLIEKGLVSYVIGFILRLMYRGQVLVVLNEPDQSVIQQIIGREPVILDGEGYKFYSVVGARPLSEELTFAYVGRLLKSKGVDKLVASFAQHSDPDWRLMLIGDSDFSNRDSVPAEKIKQLTYQSRGKIISTGFQSNVQSFLLDVDVLISLSSREGLPFSILDGISSGAYIVLSPVPGHMSFAGLPGVTFVEPSEINKFFEKVSENKELILKFDREVRMKICKKKFGQEAIVELIKVILNKQ